MDLPPPEGEVAGKCFSPNPDRRVLAHPGVFKQKGEAFSGGLGTVAGEGGGRGPEKNGKGRISRREGFAEKIRLAVDLFHCFRTVSPGGLDDRTHQEKQLKATGRGPGGMLGVKERPGPFEVADGLRVGSEACRPDSGQDELLRRLHRLTCLQKMLGQDLRRLNGPFRKLFDHRRGNSLMDGLSGRSGQGGEHHLSHERMVEDVGGVRRRSILLQEPFLQKGPEPDLRRMGALLWSLRTPCRSDQEIAVKGLPEAGGHRKHLPLVSQRVDAGGQEVSEGGRDLPFPSPEHRVGIEDLPQEKRDTVRPVDGLPHRLRGKRFPGEAFYDRPAVAP